MTVALSDRDRNLCVIALKSAERDLIAGLEASLRMGKQTPTQDVADLASEMKALRERLQGS